jgi:integrase
MAQRAYLDERVRKDGTTVGYRVRWRLGGVGPFQTETFVARRPAERFRLDVEDAGLRWPAGWVKGLGRVPDDADRPGHLFGDVADLYLNTRTRVQPDTLARYRVQVAALAEHFPIIEDIDDQAIAAWITAMRRAGKSPKTVSNQHGLLFVIAGYAVKKQLRATNPFADTQLPDRRRENPSVKALTEAEFRLVHDCIHPDSKDFIEVAVGTGARWGELTALTVDDLALDGPEPSLRIDKAWKRNATAEQDRVTGETRFVLGPPKSRRSNRTVALAAPIAATLRRVTAGKAGGDLVFTAPKGGSLRHPDWYRGRWQPAVARARQQGLAKNPVFHDLRHTHAVWLMSAGVALPVIQHRLGHGSIQITVDVYGGFLPQADAAADAAIAAALGGGQVSPRLRLIAGAPDATPLTATDGSRSTEEPLPEAREG